MKSLIIEFLGTFFLVLVITLSGNPIAIGTVLAVMVYTGGYISGAHYNPAVTLAVYLRGKVSKEKAIRYMVIQILGGLSAAFLSFLVTGDSVTPTPAPNMTFISILLLEAVFTFALAFVVLNVATSKQTEGNQYYGLAIGGTVMAAAFAIGPITGGVLNPAVAIGTILVDFTTLSANFFNMILYIVGPCLGAAIASHVYMSISQMKDESTQENKK